MLIFGKWCSTPLNVPTINYDMPQVQFIWSHSYEVMTSNVNFDVRSNLQLVINLCVVSQQLYRKITKMVQHLGLGLKPYLENYSLKNHSCLLLMLGK